MTEDSKKTDQQPSRTGHDILIDVRNGAIILAALVFAFHWAFKGAEAPVSTVGSTPPQTVKLNPVTVPDSLPKQESGTLGQTDQVVELIKARTKEVQSSQPVILKSKREEQSAAAQTAVQAPQSVSAQATQPSATPGQQGIAIPKVGFRADGSRMTKAEEAEQIKAATQKLPDEFTISWKAQDEKVKIYVFTDPTCPYCQKLHRSIPELNAAGISVHYLLYPRDIPRYASPAESPTVKNLNNVWCSVDQRAAMNEAFEGYRVKDASCDDLPADIKRIAPPVLSHFTLGSLFNVNGTPIILASNGNKVEGFSNAQQLIQRIFGQ